MGVPIVYRKSAEQALASYDFIDIASGTGSVIYYLGTGSSTNKIIKPILASETFYSHNIMSGASWTPGTDVKAVDIDWDIQFNLPQVIRGSAIFNIPLAHFTDATDTTIFSVVKVRKWDGINETTLATITGTNFIATNNGVSTTLQTLAGDIPLTAFKRGEFLRITTEVYGTTISGTTQESYVGCDPNGRISGANDVRAFASGDISVGTAIIPFRIDL